MSRIGPRDLAAEALAGILQRPGRSALTMLGTVIGIGAFVAVLGLTSTTAAQIDQRFSMLQATQVSVDEADPARRGQEPVFPADAGARMRALNGVVDAGEYWRVVLRGEAVSAMPPTAGPPAGASAGAGAGAGAGAVDVFAAAPGALRAMDASLAAGVLYNEFHEQRRSRVAVLGAAAAAQLGIDRLEDQPAIFIGLEPYAVVGIVRESARLPQLLLGVLIPQTTAWQRYGPPEPAEPVRMLVTTRLGAAQLVAGQAALALRPDQPDRFTAVAPPDPRSLRDDVTADVDRLFLLLAGVTLVIGALGIANTTMVAIIERTAEIGLRRALGARPRHIAAQLLAESAALGGFGGLLGTCLGVLAVLAVAIARNWTTAVEPATVLAAPLVGAAVGLLAGLYPALRAAAIEPITALQR